MVFYHVPMTRSLTFVSQPRPKKETKKGSAVDEGFNDSMFFGFNVETLRAHRQAAFMGYLKMNIVDPPKGAFWGKFNNRAVNDAWVEELLTDFRRKGVENCSDAMSIDVAVERDWLEATLRKAVLPTNLEVPNVEEVERDQLNKMRMSVEGVGIENVAELDFTEEGWEAIKDDNLWVLGGNHRRLALIRLNEEMKEEVKYLQDGITKALQPDVDDEGNTINAVLDTDEQESLDNARARFDELKNLLDTSQMWVVKLHNKGESARFAVGNALTR